MKQSYSLQLRTGGLAVTGVVRSSDPRVPPSPTQEMTGSFFSGEDWRTGHRGRGCTGKRRTEWESEPKTLNDAFHSLPTPGRELLEDWAPPHLFTNSCTQYTADTQYMLVE